MMTATTTKVSGSNGNEADSYSNDGAAMNHNFSMLLSPMEPSSSVAASADTIPRQNFNQWHPESSEGFLYEASDTASTLDPKQPRWSMPATSSNSYSWSRSSLGAEGREASQHSRGGRSHSTSNSSSQNSSSNYNPAGIWGNNAAFNNDDYSKSSHTSTSTLLLNMASTTHEEDDLDDSNNFLHHEDIVESSRLFSSLQLRSAGFDSHDVASRSNQPPKQPVRRPSYGTGYNAGNSFGSTDYLPSFNSNKEQDTNSSQAPYIKSSQSYGMSSLQQAAHANPYYPRSFASSSSTVPGLVGASSESVATAMTSSSTFLPRGSSSSLALAASLSQYDSMYGGPPPPGFIDRPVDFESQRKQESRRSFRGAVRAEHSPPTLKDRNTNLHPSYSLSCLNDTKDDVLSVTSTTTATTVASLRSYRPQYPHAGESSSSSYAVRALVENSTNTMIEHPSERRSSFLSVGGPLMDSIPREPSPPILPQPASEDYLLLIEREMDRDLQRQHGLSSSSNLADNDPSVPLFHSYDDEFGFMDDDNWSDGNSSGGTGGSRDGGSTDDRGSGPAKKSDWLLRMNRKLSEIPVGELDPATVPVSAVMNAWAKTKSAQGAAMVELWLKRAQEEYDLGNRRFVPTTKMYTMAVDAWARSGEGGAAAQRAEALLQHMHELYQSGGHEDLRPTNAIFNAVINAWARSREKIAPVRAEQILNWMQNLSDLDIQPDKYTFNTVIHAWAKAGGTEAATKAQELLARMHKLYQDGNAVAKPDTISYNVVINAWAKSGGKGASNEAEKLLSRMHRLHEMGDPDVKPNVVTYGAVIDSFAKSGERGAAARADTLLANMIQLHQSDPVKHADLLPNTYVFNTVINCWAKSKEHDAASKAEEMLVAMSRLHASGMPSLKPDNFTYTAVIDAWAKSGYRGAAARADQLLDKMEAKYLAGDVDLKPNSYTYNAVICALAKSGEAGAAARAERVLQNMVNRHRTGGDEDIKPTTINFNTVLDAWAKSRGGRAAAERAEEILEWMDRLHKGGNPDVKVDTISFNAVLDAWARSGDRGAPRRAEQILNHMDELYRAGNKGVKPDRYTYNTLINVWAKSCERGSAARAEYVLSMMEKRFRDGDQDFKPNTRTYTSVIDAWAKSGEKGAARRAEQILNNMISRYEAAGDPDVKPNVHTANAVCNACAFSKNEDDREEALQIAFRVFDWLANQSELDPDSYTFTILLSVCANLLPRDESNTRFLHARAFFVACRDAGYVNDYVLRKLRQTVDEDEFLSLIEYRTDVSAAGMPSSWTRNAKIDNQQQYHAKNTRKSGMGGGGSWTSRSSGRKKGH